MKIEEKTKHGKQFRMRFLDGTEKCLQDLMKQTGLTANQLVNKLIQDAHCSDEEKENETEQQSI